MRRRLEGKVQKWQYLLAVDLNCYNLWDPTSVGEEENKTFFIRAWKLLLSRPVLKTLKGSPKGKAQREQYLLAVGLGRYKWYQSQIPGGVPARTLAPEGGWIMRSNINWREKRVSVGTLGLEGRCIVIHIDWRGEKVGTRTLGPEGEWIVRSHIDWEGERNILY